MTYRFRYFKGVRYVAPWKPAPSRFAQCGACGRSWDDDKPTGLTPTPAGRCPFEHWHKNESAAAPRSEREATPPMRRLLDALEACVREYLRVDVDNGVHGAAHTAFNLLKEHGRDLTGKVKT